MKYVLLTDSDNGCALVQCTDETEANAVAAAAVFSDGGVSAWLVPTMALPDSEALRDALREGYSTYDLHEGFGAERPENYINLSIEKREA